MYIFFIGINVNSVVLGTHESLNTTLGHYNDSTSRCLLTAITLTFALGTLFLSVMEICHVSFCFSNNFHSFITDLSREVQSECKSTPA